MTERHLDPEPEYLAPREAIARLAGRVSHPRTLARWAEKGFIRCDMTLGGHHRYLREDIDRIVASAKSGRAA